LLVACAGIERAAIARDDRHALMRCAFLHYLRDEPLFQRFIRSCGACSLLCRRPVCERRPLSARPPVCDPISGPGVGRPIWDDCPARTGDGDSPRCLVHKAAVRTPTYRLVMHIRGRLDMASVVARGVRGPHSVGRVCLRELFYLLAGAGSAQRSALRSFASFARSCATISGSASADGADDARRPPSQSASAGIATS
jgi:hypothetical protein